MYTLLRYAILLADLVCVPAAVFAADWVRYRRIPDLAHVFSTYDLVIAISLLGWSVLYFWMRLDGFRGGWNFPAVFSQTLSAVFVLLVLVLAGAYLSRDYLSRLVLLHYSCSLLIGFVTVRYVAHRFLQSKFLRRAFRRSVILGNGHMANELAHKLASHPEAMCNIVGFLSPNNNGASQFQAPGSDSEKIHALGVIDLLKTLDVSELIVVAPTSADRATLDLIGRCRVAGIHVSVVPDFYELYVSKPEFLEVDGLPLISLRPYSAAASAHKVKRVLDLCLGTVLLVAASPIIVFGIVYLALSKVPVFANQLRAGKNNKSFWMYRLNMSGNGEKLPLVNRVFLKLSLTELPQLWNVVHGDMSIVGPRPEHPERTKHYTDWEKQRLSVAPGLTGLAQVHGLRESSSSADKARYDLQYILQWNPLLDVSLVLQTAWTLAYRLVGSAWRPRATSHASSPASTQTTPGLTPPSLTEEVEHAHRANSC
jgi:lipopolysaccharide/colanic/teichoic acid biosynthesis glycosyltransferase